MTIRRDALDFETNFTRLPNDWVRDARISRRARGLLAELMSHAEGWEVSMADLLRSGPEGRDALATAVAELREAGYLTIEQGRATGGRFAEVAYVITSPLSGFPVAVEPVAVEPVAANPHPYKKNNSLEEHLEEDQPAKRARASRIPEPFLLTKQMREWAAAEHPGVNVETATRNFVDHWRAEASSKARKLDWTAAWRTWIRNEERWAPRGVPSGGHKETSLDRSRAGVQAMWEGLGYTFDEHGGSGPSAQHALGPGPSGPGS